VSTKKTITLDNVR